MYFVEKRFNVFFINFTMKLSGFIKILTYILMVNLCPCFKIIEELFILTAVTYPIANVPSDVVTIL